MSWRRILVVLSLITGLTTPHPCQINTFGPNTATNWLDKGIDLYIQGKYEESLLAYDKAIQANESTEAWNNKGLALERLGRYDEAIQAFYRAIELKPSYAEAWYNMGMTYDARGDYERAIQAYDKATEIDPSFEQAWYNKNADIDASGIPHTSLYLELTGQRSNN